MSLIPRGAHPRSGAMLVLVQVVFLGALTATLRERQSVRSESPR